MTRLMLSPQGPALFATSLMETSGHKMVALMVVFSQLSAAVFVTNGARNQVESLRVSYFYYFVHLDGAHETSLLRVSFKPTHPQSQVFTARIFFCSCPF